MTTQVFLDHLIDDVIPDLKHQTDYARRLAPDICTQATCDRHNAALIAFQKILRMVMADGTNEHGPVVTAILEAIKEKS